MERRQFTNRPIPGSKGRAAISGRGRVKGYRDPDGNWVKGRPRFSAVTVKSMDSGEVLRTEPAYVKPPPKAKPPKGKRRRAR